MDVKLSFLLRVCDTVDKFTNVIIVVICGSRLDLLHHVRQRMKKQWPKARPWVVQMTAGGFQSLARKPGYIMFLELTHGKPITSARSEYPHTLDILKCNLKD